MKDNEYLSIAEFAKKAGVTKQAIYLRLNKDLNPYLKVLESKKYLKIEALELFGVKPLEQVLETKDSSTLIDLAGHLQKQYEQSQEENKRFDRLVDMLEADNEKLHAQLDIKDGQIRDLSRQMDDASKRLAEYSQLLHQQQVLNARSDARLEAATIKEFDQYDKGYKDAKDKFYKEMKRAAQILNDKFPEAADYLVKELGE